MEINTIQWLPIETTHCAEVTELPFYHRDPFDRMLNYAIGVTPVP